MEVEGSAQVVSPGVNDSIADDALYSGASLNHWAADFHTHCQAANDRRHKLNLALCVCAWCTNRLRGDTETVWQCGIFKDLRRSLCCTVTHKFYQTAVLALFS